MIAQNHETLTFRTIEDHCAIFNSKSDWKSDQIWVWNGSESVPKNQHTCASGNFIVKKLIERVLVFSRKRLVKVGSIIIFMPLMFMCVLFCRSFVVVLCCRNCCLSHLGWTNCSFGNAEALTILWSLKLFKPSVRSLQATSILSGFMPKNYSKTEAAQPTLPQLQDFNS